MSDPQMKAPIEGVPPVAEPQAPAPVEPKDERFEQLARKEKALRAQARQLQQEKQQIEALKAQKPQTDDSWKTRLKTDLAGMLAEAGLSHEEFAGNMMNVQPMDVNTKRLETRIAELESKLNKTAEDMNSGQQKAYDQAIKQVTRDINLLVDAEEAYETIKSTGSQDAVLALIEDTYKEDGVLLSTEEACKQVEDYLLKEAISLAKLKKVQQRLQPTEPVKAPEPVKSQIQKTSTLTHAITQAAGTKTNMSAKERRDRAIAAFINNTK